MQSQHPSDETTRTSLLCRLGFHKYDYDKKRFGDVFAIEKQCMRCGKYKLSEPQPAATPS